VDANYMHITVDTKPFRQSCLAFGQFVWACSTIRYDTIDEFNMDSKAECD